jgi:hypothetical protein
MEDIRDACTVVNRTAGEIGMTEDERRKSIDLLERYGSERSRLFEEMLSSLSKSDTSDLRNSWKSQSDKGKDLLDRLDRELPKTAMGEGLNGVGAKDFASGEKKTWEESGKAEVAFVADVINKIFNADLGLIKKCNEDLKTVRDNDKVVEALVQANLGGLKTELKDVGKTLAIKLGEKALTMWLKTGSHRDYIKKWYSFVVRSTDDNYQAAKQKRVVKQTLLDNIELLRKTKEQLSEEWIEAMYKKGEEFSKSLGGVGRTGSYNATDWNRFGESCYRSLAERRDKAKEQSKIVFNELLPTFLEENNRAFAALTDDPSKLETWKSEMKDDFKSIEDVLSKQDELVKALAEGPFKQAVKESFDELRMLLTTGFKLLFDRTKDSEDEMKK